MPTILNIEDPEAQALAQELARLEHKSLTQVIKEALRESLERKKHQPGLADRLMDLGAQCAKLPVLDSRTPNEILGYDEMGLPR